MTGPCLCGDPFCASCGTAQGTVPDQQRSAEGLRTAWGIQDVRCPACRLTFDVVALLRGRPSLTVKCRWCLQELVVVAFDPERDRYHDLDDRDGCDGCGIDDVPCPRHGTQPDSEDEDDYDYAADDLAFDAAREDRLR